MGNPFYNRDELSELPDILIPLGFSTFVTEEGFGATGGVVPDGPGQSQGIPGSFRQTNVALRIRVPNTRKMYQFWGPRLCQRATWFYAVYVWTVFWIAWIGLGIT